MRNTPTRGEPLTPRLFDSDFLEFFSKVHVSVPVLLFAPLISVFAWLGVTDPAASLPVSLLSLLSGIVQWSLVEYLIHRFVFHYEPKTEFGRRFFYIMHGVHHDYPNDPLRLVMPPAVSLPATVALFALGWALYPSHVLYPMAVGFGAAYLFYDLSHYAFHHWNFRNRVWQAMRTHHMRHHFRDNKARFGVTSTFWDRVFGTL